MVLLEVVEDRLVADTRANTEAVLSDYLDGYAQYQGWMVDVPVSILAGAVGAALALGALAGLYPAAAQPS